MPNYQNSKIYGIYEEEKLVYIGSTTQLLSTRKNEHWCRVRKENGFKIHRYMQEIGLNKFSLKLIEPYPCNNINELNNREGELQRLHKNEIMNVRINNQTLEEWYVLNRKDLCQKKKDYNIKNGRILKDKKKEKYEERKQERITCECGSNIMKIGLKDHIKTELHIKYLENKT